MTVPFSREEFLAVFARYNEATFPASIILVAAAVFAIIAALSHPKGMRVLLGLVGVLWLWMGVVYHAALFSALTPAGYIFALAFVAQGAMILHVARTMSLERGVLNRTSAAVAATLIAYALVGYPLVGYAVGQRYPAAPTFGLPCPTTIFTLGVFAWCGAPIPRGLLVIPALWAVVGTSAALLFGVTEDLALLPAVALVVASRMRPRTSAIAAR